MLKIAFARYINNFRGFSKEIWILTLMTFINRAGTMVIPFLSKYLKEDLHFSYNQVGTIMVFFGIGSMLGSWLGGKLTDKIGFYKIMLFSLFTSGVAFFLIERIKSFTGLCIGLFLIMTIADMFRPAMFVSLNTYATNQTRTRALTLVRLAVNLGFALGPALGGLIIMGLGYKGLFWIDGATCILAILIFGWFVKDKPKDTATNSATNSNASNVQNSVFKDSPFWVFVGCCMIGSILFFQLFSTIPLYHKEQFHLNEFQSGLLLMLNGLLIFFLEMPIVSYVERKQINKVKMVILGTLAMTLGIFIMVIDSWVGILIVMMLFMTFGEIFIFPFSNSLAMARAPKGHEGRYMAIFTMSFSAAHILSAKMGMSIIEYFKKDALWKYNANWIFMGFLGIVAIYLGYRTYQLTEKEKIAH